MTRKSCEHLDRSGLAAWCAGRDPDEHEAACSDCRRLRAQYESIARALKQLPPIDEPARERWRVPRTDWLLKFRGSTNPGSESFPLSGTRARRFGSVAVELVAADEPLEAPTHQYVLPQELASRLSPSELHVVEMAALGHSKKKIAAVRGVSMSTIGHQLRSACRRLEVHSLAEIVALFSAVAR